MAYLDNFNPEKIDSVPEIRQQFRFLKKAIDNGEIGGGGGGNYPPESGVPKSDLSEEVQTSLEKADTAYDTANTNITNIAANAEDIETLQAAYAGLTQSDIVVGALPESGEANTIYRVPDANSYSDYMWDGTQFVKMATYNNALTFTPYCAQLLKKILKNGAYTQDVQQDINDLIDAIDTGSSDVNVVSPSVRVDNYNISIVNEDRDSDATMYYTLDGSTPTADSTEYTTPFKSQYDCTINAIAVNSNDEVSRVSSVEYTAGAVEYIDFADKTVLEPLVVSLADTSGDGKVTPAEAGLVANIGTTFKGKAITSFEELNFFTGITELKFQSFSGCSSLKTIRVPKNVTKIDNQSFQDCTDLEMIYLPDGITTMCSCFGGATGTHNTKLKIAGKKLPSSLNSFSGYYADDLRFTGCAELELDELPPHLPKISTYMFSGCSKLALTSLPGEIASIGTFAFNGCSKLAITEIPASVSGTIAGSTFKSCSSLVSLNIKGSITGITGDYAFQYCSNLEEVIFPETMTTWSGLFTFNGCTKLTKIVLKSPSVVALSRTSDDTIGANSNIYVPASLVESYLADAKWSTISNASNRIKAIEE